MEPNAVQRLKGEFILQSNCISEISAGMVTNFPCGSMNVNEYQQISGEFSDKIVLKCSQILLFY